MKDCKMPQVRGNTDPLEVFDYLLQQHGKLAFDIGANGGFLAENLCRSFDNVVACEPAVESYDHLHSRWGIQNLLPLNVAVSDHVGEVTLGVKKLTNQWGELFTGDSLAHWGPDFDTRTVECTTLDALASQFGFPDFVKIDVEGHEVNVVNGGHKVFSQLPHYCIEIHGTEHGDAIQEFLVAKDLSFRVIRHDGYLQEKLPEQFKGDYDRHYWIVG
jgi:FkbM family methyltransferase